MSLRVSAAATLPTRPEYPPLEGEGRIAEGDPGWGDGRAAGAGDAEYAETLSPPPGPLTRADLPPSGGGEAKTEVSFLALSVRHDCGVEVGAFNQCIGQDRILQVGAFEACAAHIGAMQIGPEQVDPGKSRAA